MTEKDQKLTAHDSAPTKAFVNEDGHTTLVCPNCNSVKSVNAGPFRERQHRLKVRCSCSKVFAVNLDFRKCFRKPTQLEGVFDMTPPASGGGKVTIINLSLEGACFEVIGIHRLETAQKGTINFTLDDRKNTRLKRDFIVRMVKGNKIGVEFKKAQAFQKELGFYLRFGP